MDDPAGRNYFANILTIDTFRIQKLKHQFHRLVPVRYPTKRRQARQPRRQKECRVSKKRRLIGRVLFAEIIAGRGVR
jgi:hypothetical protein